MKRSNRSRRSFVKLDGIESLTVNLVKRSTRLIRSKISKDRRSKGRKIELSTLHMNREQNIHSQSELSQRVSCTTTVKNFFFFSKLLKYINLVYNVPYMFQIQSIEYYTYGMCFLNAIYSTGTIHINVYGPIYIHILCPYHNMEDA